MNSKLDFLNSDLKNLIDSKFEITEIGIYKYYLTNNHVVEGSNRKVHLMYSD